MLCVDDIFISGNDVVGIKELNNHLMSTFKMKAMEHLTYFVGLESHSQRLIFKSTNVSMPKI